MGKWIFSKNSRPPEYSELLCIFDTMPDEVWHARREGNKYFGSCLDEEDQQEINGELLCWKPWPVSPFRLAQQNEKTAQFLTPESSATETHNDLGNRRDAGPIGGASVLTDELAGND